MRSLVVAQDFPWPPVTGSFQRLASVVRALATLGDVELFSLVYPGRRESCDVPADAGVTRHEIAVTPAPRLSVPRRAAWLWSELPLEVFSARLSEPRSAFDGWARDGYDVVWISKAATFHGLGRPRLGPTVVDLDDLEDRKLRARRTCVLRSASGPVRSRLRARAGSVQLLVNEQRWRSLQRSVSSEVERVALCSALDVARSCLPNAVVVENGYDLPGAAAVAEPGRRPPVVLLQGVLRYGPNQDAASYLVHEVGPRLRALVPGCRIRLVGEPDGVVRRLHAPPDVVVTGPVGSMAPELAGAGVVAVPLRYASGTRIKILEAFAHGVPVVSTPIGAEGLDVVDGTHLLLAGPAEDFARACAQVLLEPSLADRLRKEARCLVAGRYSWERSRRQMVALAGELRGCAGVGGPGGSAEGGGVT